MKWYLGNVAIRVLEATSDERNWLSDYLSYVDTSYRPGRRRHEDQRVQLYNIVTDEFPAGFGRIAHAEAQARGYTIELVDGRSKPCEPDFSADLRWLRHHPAVTTEITHQIEAVQAAVTQKRGVIWVPTGGGKCEIAIGISRILPCRFLFLVHRTDLLAQTAKRYEARTGTPAGIVGDGKAVFPDGCRFVVCTFQTMHAAFSHRPDVLAMLRSAEGIIIDECHALPAKTFFNVAMQAKNAYYRFGLSGTPLARSEGDNLLVVGGLGPVIYRVLPKTLSDLGLLAVPHIRMVEVIQLSDQSKWAGVYRECITGSAKRNGVVVETVRRAAKPCLVFVQHIDHGKRLTALLTRAGMKAEFVWGEESTTRRQAAIERLVRTDVDVLVCNVIFQEGVDIPSLRSVVVATGGASVIATLQRIGRGMRADAVTGKHTFEVYDFFDRGCGCRPDRDQGMHSGCKWLEKHSLARVKAYQNEGFEPEHEKEQMHLNFKTR